MTTDKADLVKPGEVENQEEPTKANDDETV